MNRIAYLIYLFSILSFSQPSSDGLYFDGVDDFFTVPGTSNINSSTTNNRTYETYFKVTSTTPRQVIMEEGGGSRAVVFYVENGYLVVGAYNRADYTPNWQGTFYRKAISANTWYHLAFVFDNALPGNASTNPMNTSANTALKWYLDGVLQTEISGYQFGPHNATVLGYKDGTLRFPNCGTWTTSGLSEYCFGSIANDTGSGEYYFQGNLWGYRMWSDVRTLAEINDNLDTIITSVGTDNLVAILDGDTFTYLDSSNNPSDVSISNPAAPITWKSNAGSTDWNTMSNWNGGSIPDANKKESVVIPTSTNYPVITSHVKAGDLEVQTGAEVTVNDGGTLDINYDLLNNGTITVNNNGSLVNRESKPVSGSGTFIINRDSPNYPADYYSIWSTPIDETDSQIGTVFNNAIIGYKYDASQNPSAYVQVGGSNFMEVGKGYFIRSDNESGVLTRTFNGTINNGIIDKNIYFNSATDNFNLIGNPYSSSIDWLKFHADNNDVLSGTMYYWNQSIVGVNNSASDYISFNSTGSSEPLTTGNIATGLGVFIKSTQAGTVTFSNTHRVVGNNDQFFRTSENPDDGKSWFRLSGATGYSPILIGFVPGATDAYESDFDGVFVNEGATIELYSFIGNDKYEIQGRSELQANHVIQMPLGYQVTTAGDYTISMELDFIDTSFEILLEDTLLNTMTDLRVSDYTFNVGSPQEDDSRFILHYDYNQTLSLDEFVDESNSLNTYFLNDELVTNNVSKDFAPLTIQLFDISGKEILKMNFEERLQTRNLSSGIYIANYSYQDSRTVSKKVIKR